VERVGFVGLGIMGAPMARNALRAGFPVTVTNRTLERAKPFGEAGATIARTPREVAERSDIVVTMVTNTPDVEAVIFGPEGVAAGAHDGLLAIDMSTVSPVATREFATRAACGYRARARSTRPCCSTAISVSGRVARRPASLGSSAAWATHGGSETSISTCWWRKALERSRSIP